MNSMGEGIEICDICGLRLSHRDWCAYSGKRVGTRVMKQPFVSRLKSFLIRVVNTYRQH